MTASVRRTLCLALVLPFFALALVAGTGAAQATPAHFNPPKGPTFNNPFGTNAARFAINTKLIRTINSVGRVTRSGSRRGTTAARASLVR